MARNDSNELIKQSNPSKRDSLKLIFSLSLGVTIAGLGLSVSQAGTVEEFDLRAFEAARASGQPVVLAVHAWWCGTCRAQKPVQKQIMSETGLEKVRLFVIDFDRNKKWLKSMNISAQSVMVVYVGPNEFNRSMGETNSKKLSQQIRSALSANKPA
jgi:thiol-disulfide isomerase/thioredoxin